MKTIENRLKILFIINLNVLCNSGYDELIGVCLMLLFHIVYCLLGSQKTRSLESSSSLLDKS